MILLISLNVYLAGALVTLNGATHPIEAANSHQLTVTTTPSYGGTVTPTSAGKIALASPRIDAPDSVIYDIFYQEICEVELTANASAGYTFDHWSIGGLNVGNSSKYVCTMTNSTEVKAVFTSQIPFNSSKPLYQVLAGFSETMNFTANEAYDTTSADFTFMIEHLVGTQLGVYSMQDLAAFAGSLPSGNGENALKAQAVLYAYTLLMPYGITNRTAIEWALDNQPMMPNGLPDTGSAVGLEPAFWLQNRAEINGYYWAKLYDHDTAKWNLTMAYNGFESAIDAQSDGSPATLYVSTNGTTYNYWGHGQPRYYDECAQTIDTYLRFYELGVTPALSKALDVWNYLNANDWYGDHYGYHVGGESFECEIGGLNAIALKLNYYVPNLPFSDRITTNINSSLIQSQFDSIQWTPNRQGALIVHDYAIDGPSSRLENTVTAWASLYGSYNSLTSENQQKIRNMINGANNPANLTAWQYTLSTDGANSYSRLYNPYLNLFEMHETSPPVWSLQATATAESLLILLGITPQTTSLAVPLVDNIYEDLGSIVNPNLVQLNLNTSALRIPVASRGTLDFHYGTQVTSYAFPDSGIYTIQFSPDYNSIISATRLSALPSTYVYYGQAIKPEATNSVPPSATTNLSQTSQHLNSTSSNIDAPTYENTKPMTSFADYLRIWNLTLLTDSLILSMGIVICMVVILRNAKWLGRKALGETHS